MTAIHAKLCINRILHSAVATLNRKLATRHCNEQSAGFFNDTDVMHNEFVVDHNRTIGSKTIFAALTKIHLDFRNSHCTSPVVYLLGVTLLGTDENESPPQQPQSMPRSKIIEVF